METVSLLAILANLKPLDVIWWEKAKTVTNSYTKIIELYINNQLKDNLDKDQYNQIIQQILNDQFCQKLPQYIEELLEVKFSIKQFYSQNKNILSESLYNIAVELTAICQMNLDMVKYNQNLTNKQFVEFIFRLQEAKKSWENYKLQLECYNQITSKFSNYDHAYKIRISVPDNLEEDNYWQLPVSILKTIQSSQELFSQLFGEKVSPINIKYLEFIEKRVIEVFLIISLTSHNPWPFFSANLSKLLNNPNGLISFCGELLLLFDHTNTTTKRTIQKYVKIWQAKPINLLKDAKVDITEIDLTKYKNYTLNNQDLIISKDNSFNNFFEKPPNIKDSTAKDSATTISNNKKEHTPPILITKPTTEKSQPIIKAENNKINPTQEEVTLTNRSKKSNDAKRSSSKEHINFLTGG